MENLLQQSQHTPHKNQSTCQKLNNLSPEKYGHHAYRELTYTPSKLADNVLYRQVTTMKKIEEECGKLRQSQAMGEFLQEKVNQLQQERDGIQQSLVQQINMYKKIIAEMEIKHQNRIKTIQKSVTEEIHKLIQDKMEQAKFAQSEKQYLQTKINQMQENIDEMNRNLQEKGNNYEQLHIDRDKLGIQLNNIQEKLKNTEDTMLQKVQQAKQNYQQLSRKLYQSEVDAGILLQKQMLEKNKQIEQINQQHRLTISQVQTKNQEKMAARNQQIKELTQTFDNQCKRLNDIIMSRESCMTNLTAENNNLKDKILQQTRANQSELTCLRHEKGKILEDNIRIQQQISTLQVELNRSHHSYNDTVNSYEHCINRLKQEQCKQQLEKVSEINNYQSLISKVNSKIIQSQGLIDSLKHQNECIRLEDQCLRKQLSNLKELLLESSHELQQCKLQFIRLGSERDSILLQLHNIKKYNDNLKTINEIDESKAWRVTDKYYNR